MAKGKVAVVLVTFNRLEKLKIALECYKKQTYPISKLIIVDNCSKDGTVTFLENWDAENKEIDSTVLYLSENTGGAGGFGAGMDLALEQIYEKKIEVDWILVSDDDAFPEPDAIEKMFSYYYGQDEAMQKQIVALSSTVINHGEIHEAHRSKITQGTFRIKFKGIDKSEYLKDAFELDLFSYVGTMIKVSALEKAGTTKKELFIYGDDNEHSLRLRKIGKLICVTASRFIHDTPGVETREIGWHNYYNRRNQLYILKMYFPKRYFLARYIKRYLFDISFLSKYTKEERKLFAAAHTDAIKGRLGKHPLYKPGFHF